MSVPVSSAPPDTPAAGTVRAMRKAALGGQHTHVTTCGVSVHVYERGGRYLARGRYDGAVFGKTLGGNPSDAAAALRRLLTKIEDGAFVRPSAAPRRRLGPLRAPRLTLRQLAEAYLEDKRKVRGRKTADTYLSRLRPVLDFAEAPGNLQRWTHAADVDREFAVGLRSYLHGRATTRNGKAGAAPRPLSGRQIVNVLECVRGMLAWAARAEVRLLPVGWANPFVPDVVGSPPRKDPLRDDPLPQNARILLVGRMDRWQLCHLATSLVLPLRPAEAAGLLVGDVDWERARLTIGTRFGGADFTKGGTSFRLPFPTELRPLLEACAGGRPEGPLLRDRRVFEGRKKVRTVASAGDLEALLSQRLAAEASGDVATSQDRKTVFRDLLRELGGVSEDQLGREFRRAAGATGLRGVSVGTLRHSVTTAMSRCGMRLLELRYLTSHTTGDILNEYVSLDLDGAAAAYFESAGPLLRAIATRAEELGIVS